MWVLVNVNQLIAFMPLMSIHFPANTLLLFEFLAFLNGDILLLERAFEFSLGRSYSEVSSPYNERF